MNFQLSCKSLTCKITKQHGLICQLTLYRETKITPRKLATNTSPPQTTVSTPALPSEPLPRLTQSPILDRNHSVPAEPPSWEVVSPPRRGKGDIGTCTITCSLFFGEQFAFEFEGVWMCWTEVLRNPIRMIGLIWISSLRWVRIPVGELLNTLVYWKRLFFPVRFFLQVFFSDYKTLENIYDREFRHHRKYFIWLQKICFRYPSEILTVSLILWKRSNIAILILG